MHARRYHGLLSRKCQIVSLSYLHLGIAEQGEQVLSDYLIGFQTGNDPDLYASHGHRPENQSFRLFWRIW